MKITAKIRLLKIKKQALTMTKTWVKSKNQLKYWQKKTVKINQTISNKRSLKELSLNYSLKLNKGVKKIYASVDIAKTILCVSIDSFFSQKPSFLFHFLLMSIIFDQNYFRGTKTVIFKLKRDFSWSITYN
jgi:hypothetical protein